MANVIRSGSKPIYAICEAANETTVVSNAWTPLTTVSNFASTADFTFASGAYTVKSTGLYRINAGGSVLDSGSATVFYVGLSDGTNTYLAGAGWGNNGAGVLASPTSITAFLTANDTLEPVYFTDSTAATEVNFTQFSITRGI